MHHVNKGYATDSKGDFEHGKKIELSKQKKNLPYVTVKFKYSQSVCDLNKFFGNNCTEVQQSFVLYFQYDFVKFSF